VISRNKRNRRHRRKTTAAASVTHGLRFFSFRVIRHTDLLDRLGNRLTSPPVDFDLSQLGDDLLGQFFVSA
jgi:hypothetical protein